MKCLIHPIKTAVILFLMFSTLGLGYRKEIKAPVVPIEHWTLPNGANIYYVPSHQLPIVDLGIIIDGGSNQDGAQSGIANMTMHMIGEGTNTMDADTIAENFDKVGAIFNAQIQRDHTAFSLRSLSDKQYFQPAMNTFSAILLHPQLTPKSLDRIKNQTLQDIDSQEQTPREIANNILYEALYNKTPYSHHPLGKASVIKALKSPDLMAFYKRFYVGKNTTLILVGDLSKKQAKQIARSLLTPLPAGEKAPKVPTPKTPSSGHLIHSLFPTTQTTVRMGQLGLAPNDPDYYALKVGNYIFGEGPLVSRLFKEVREERGLSYNVKSYFYPLKEAGTFIISLETRNNKAPEAIKVVRKTLKGFLEEGPSMEEIEGAKQHLISAFPLNLKSNRAILDKVAHIAFYQLPLNFISTYQQSISTVDKQAIMNAFHRHLIPSQLITVMVGPSSPAPRDKHG